MSAGGRATAGRARHVGGASVYDIRDFGAKGDGVILDTRAVQSAIDACAADGGGMVLIPPGVFVIGSTELKSNVTLHLCAGGVLRGSGDGGHYHAAEGIPLEGDATLDDGNVGLLYAVGAENFAIVGLGTIDGQGARFRSPGGAQRPHMMLFHQCRNVVIRDVFLKDGAYHAVRIIQSRFVKADGVRMHSRVVFNGDGFHFISCEHVHVTRCDVECIDDACALFGACRNVTVSDCVFTTRWSVFRLWGGDAENIAVTNCVIHTTFGCPIKIQIEGTSRVQNIMFSNLILKDVTGPITINRTPASSPLALKDGRSDADGYVRNIRFSNIQATVIECGWQQPDVPWTENYRSGETRQCIVLNGVKGLMLEAISFSDIRVVYAGGGTAEEAGRAVPEVGGEYFEIGTPPAYGLYARNVRGLTLNNIRFEVMKPDARPAVVFDQVSDVYACGMNPALPCTS